MAKDENHKRTGTSDSEEYDSPGADRGGLYHAIPPHLPQQLLHRHRLTVQDVVVRCNMDRSYAYQLFNGTRRPSRDFLLRLALLLKLGEDEAQRLLKIAGRQPLYARSRRDAAVLYGLTHNLTADATQDLLAELGEGGLA